MEKIQTINDLFNETEQDIKKDLGEEYVDDIAEHLDALKDEIRDKVASFFNL